jgi:hypothetical protein
MYDMHYLPAPTGAVGFSFHPFESVDIKNFQGKTDVAMLTVLRVIDQNLSSSAAKSCPAHLPSAIKRDDFKIIYVFVNFSSILVLFLN